MWFPSSQPNVPPAGLGSGIAQHLGPDCGGSSRGWVSRHAGAGGVADRRVGVQIVQPLGAPPGPQPSDPLQGKLADATGYPLHLSRLAAGKIRPSTGRQTSSPIRTQQPQTSRSETVSRLPPAGPSTRSRKVRHLGCSPQPLVLMFLDKASACRQGGPLRRLSATTP